jgi:hypothetical protein
MNTARFKIRLTPERRRELEDLAREAGLSSADLARLGIGWLLRHPGVLLGGGLPADGAR